MDTLLQDLRYAVRQLAKNKAFTAVAVITLALGVGATTAVFSLANWVALRPLPGVPHGDELVAVGFRTGRGFESMSYASLLDFGAGVTTLHSFAGERTGWEVPVTVSSSAPRLGKLTFVSGNYFDALGVIPRMGRVLTASDERAGAPPVAVITSAYWRARLQSDPDILGKTIRVLRADVTIVGVMPEGFQGINRLLRPDLWMVATTAGVVTGDADPGYDPVANRRSGIFSETFGRLAPGATIEQAEAQVRSVARQVAAAYPPSDGFRTGSEIQLRRTLGVPMSAREKVTATMKLLMGIAGLVLLIAAANFANLLVFRGMRRRGEASVRAALGASRGRLIRASVAESVVLAAVGGCLALLLAVWIVSLFRGAAFAGLAAIDTVQLDTRVVAFGAIVALALGVGCGLVPHLSVGRAGLSTRLRDAAGKGSGRRTRLRSGMVIVQLAASLTLLVGAALLITTLRNLRAVDVGFDAARVQTFFLNPNRAGYSGERSAALLEDLRARIAAIPGVERTSFTFMAPFSRLSFGDGARSAFLSPDAKPVGVTDVWVSPGYFQTLGIPTLRGRDFSREEFHPGAGDPADVVVISTTVSRQLFGDRDPIGQYLTSRRFKAGAMVDQPFRVVGVVGDSKSDQLAGAVAPMLYHLLGEGPTATGQAPGLTIMVRSVLPSARLRPLVESTIAALAPSIPVTESASLREKIDQGIAEQRLFAKIVTLLTALAVGLAGVGLYGLVGFAVAERTREFGIRVALGAQMEQILNLVVREGALLAGVGVTIGTAGAVLLSRLIANRLFGVTPFEPYVYVGATALLVLVVLIASIIPARAATRVDPMVALRSE